MSRVGTPTLEQLRVLKAVAETGSFSGAARALGKAQSVISYAIDNLEAQLGLSLFERRSRGPVLTEAGAAILVDARRVADDVERLRARAEGMGQGLEAAFSVAIDVMFPTERLVAALEGFGRDFPTVTLDLRIEALGGVAQSLLDGRCSLGVCGWAALEHASLSSREIGAVALIPVAAPGHPLAAEGAYPYGVRDHVQLVLADRSALTAGREFGVVAATTWRLGDLGAKHALLRAGLGWGNMPEPMVREDLVSGRLTRLEPLDDRGEPYALYLCQRKDRVLGPAGRWLSEALASLCAGDLSQRRV